jgi:hypothetical protein
MTRRKPEQIVKLLRKSDGELAKVSRWKTSAEKSKST